MKILVVEDNLDILDNIFEFLEPKGHILDAAQDGCSGLHLATVNHYDAIVLDLMLPGINGLAVLEKLRKEAQIGVPILILTAKAEVEDRVAGLSLGADDYLVKPFALAELEARLEALIRRRNGINESRVLAVGDLQFDTQTLEVSRGGQSIELNQKTRSILLLLMKESPRVVSKERIEQALWGEEPPDGDALRSHIYQLRTAIDKPFEDKLLKTLPKEGYRLVAAQ